MKHLIEVTAGGKRCYLVLSHIVSVRENNDIVSVPKDGGGSLIYATDNETYRSKLSMDDLAEKIEEFYTQTAP